MTQIKSKRDLIQFLSPKSIIALQQFPICCGFEFSAKTENCKNESQKDKQLIIIQIRWNKYIKILKEIFKGSSINHVGIWKGEGGNQITILLHKA